MVFQEFEDLDEIIARHIQPMASHARDIINFKNYLESDAGKKEILEKKLYEDKKKPRPGQSLVFLDYYTQL